MNLRGTLLGMLIGALVALVITFEQRWRERHAPVATAPSATASAAPLVFEPAQPIDARLRQHAEQDAWLRRRDLEFDKCAALHGTPTLGFGTRLVCLDSHAVKFLGEQHPPDE